MSLEILDRLVQGAKPAAQYDLLQATGTSGAGWAQGSAAHESVSAPSFSNSWVNFGGSLSNAGYYKDPLGRVHLRGSVKSGTAGTSIFTLPSGYRPAADRVFAVDANGAHCQLTVTSSGTVVPAAGGGNTQISLDGVSFEV